MVPNWRFQARLAAAEHVCRLAAVILLNPRLDLLPFELIEPLRAGLAAWRQAKQMEMSGRPGHILNKGTAGQKEPPNDKA